MMMELLYFFWEVVPRIAAAVTTVVFLSKLRAFVSKKTPSGLLPGPLLSGRAAV
jgi:hypothetical protein